MLDGSAVNNAIIPIIGAGKRQCTWGYFNAPYFPTQDDPPIANYRQLLVEKYGRLPRAGPTSTT